MFTKICPHLVLLFGVINLAYAQTVTIGTQVWSTKNLEVTKFRNGDPIPQAKTNEEWENAGKKQQSVWCYYNNEPANGAKYGKLYNWYAVNDPRGLAPKGWHIPTDAEFTNLSDFLGGASVAGNKMKNNSGWNNNGNGTNESGFSARPGGCRFDSGKFDYIGYSGFWWSSTEYSVNAAWYRFLSWYDSNVTRNFPDKGLGLSVRCLRD